MDVEENKPNGKPKFGYLVKGSDEDLPKADDEEAESLEDLAADDGPLSEEKGAYDLKACANDMMSAFQAGDVEALEMALSDLLAKKVK